MKQRATRPEASSTLIVAASGRALAASAARAGLPVVVLDCFADRDTRALARDSHTIQAPGTFRFDARVLLGAANRLAPAAPLVYGSGFDGRTTLLARLAEGRRLLGNPPAVVAAVKSARRFFPLLDRLGIRHPEVRYAPPDYPGDWLVKRSGGAGGTHVRRAGTGRLSPGWYFQRFVPGDPCSALFLADGRRGFVIGFNRQWTASQAGGLSFTYAGAAGQLPLPPPLEADLRAKIDSLVSATGLVGLNGLDFLLTDGAWSALEVNPRPTATMELYDPDFPRGLLDLHIRAVQGELPEQPVPDGPARAHAIVLASEAWQVPSDFAFPEWCRDLPGDGVRFSTGDPVCTVHAVAATSDRAGAMARERKATLERSLQEAAMLSAHR